MNVIKVWKVPAAKTQAFFERMREKRKRRDALAVLLNLFAGLNYFYETDESYGDISEESAHRTAQSYNVEIEDF